MCEDSEVPFLSCSANTTLLLFWMYALFQYRSSQTSIFWPWGNDLFVINRIIDLQGQVIHPLNHCRITLAFPLKYGLLPELEEVNLLFTCSPSPTTSCTMRTLSCSMLPVFRDRGFPYTNFFTWYRNKETTIRSNNEGKTGCIGLSEE